MKNTSLPIYDIQDFEYLGKEGFYANDFASHLNQHDHLILAPHKHNFYVSVLFTKGLGTHEIEFVTYPIKPGSIFMLSPGQVHNWVVSKDIGGFIFFHTKEFYDLNFTYEKIDKFPFYCSLRNSPLINLKSPVGSKIEPLYKEIVEEYRQERLWKFQRLASLLNILYISVSREYLPVKTLKKQNASYLARVKRLENLIDKHYKHVKSPTQYAEMMFISEKHLNRMCKETLNKTVSDLIAERIILEAKRLLVHSSISVGEIITELGYADHPYFFRFFKKKTSMTPLEFMNKHRAA